MPLPLKFNFRFEEPHLPEKLEEEKEMDKLWAELDFALRSSEIGAVDSNTVGPFCSIGLKLVMCYYSINIVAQIG